MLNGMQGITYNLQLVTTNFNLILSRIPIAIHLLYHGINNDKYVAMHAVNHNVSLKLQNTSIDIL